MAVITSAEEKIQQDRKEERRQTLAKFWQYFRRSFLFGIKVGAALLLIVILAYCCAKYIFKWDLFYETDVKYSLLCLIAFAALLVIMFVCWVGGFVLYNTPHTRNTKYK